MPDLPNSSGLVCCKFFLFHELYWLCPLASFDLSFVQCVASGYAWYARFISRFGAGVFILGLMLAVIACIGLMNVQTVNDVLDVWM